MVRSHPFQVKMPVWRAKASGVPRLKNPPFPEYSPSVFSRITRMSTVSGVAVLIGEETPGYSFIGRRFTYWSKPLRIASSIWREM